MSNVKRILIKLMPDGFLYALDVSSGKFVRVNPLHEDLAVYLVAEHPDIEILKKPFPEVIEMAHFELKN